MCTPKPVLSTSSRAFWGGAFETEFEENRAKARRRRLRGFLGSMELLPAGAMAAPQEIIRSIFAEHAPDGSFRSQEHLRQAVDGVRRRLSVLQTAGPFILQLEASDSGSSSVGAAAPDSPSPPNDHASPNALTTPPPLPPSELPELPPDVLTELQQHTLASMRMAAAIDGLPSLWTALAQPAPSAGAAEPASQNGALTVPLPLAVDAAFALSDPDPWERVRFRVSLAQSQVGGRVAVEAKATAPTADEVRAAARSTVHAAEPLLRMLLAQTEMLDQPERQRLAALQLAAPTCLGAHLSAPKRARTFPSAALAAQSPAQRSRGALGGALPQEPSRAPRLAHPRTALGQGSQGSYGRGRRCTARGRRRGRRTVWRTVCGTAQRQRYAPRADRSALRVQRSAIDEAPPYDERTQSHGAVRRPQLRRLRDLQPLSSSRVHVAFGTQ